MMRSRDIDEDILHVAREEELRQADGQQPRSRLWALGIALFLFVLMLSFVFVTFPIGDIIAGQIESRPLEGGIVEAGGLRIVFREDALRQLQGIYYEEQRREFSLCMQGAKEGNSYGISGLYQPTTYHQTFSSVTFESCSDDTLIILHSHPYKSCIASEADMRMLERSKERNPDVLMVVMCEPGRFSVYG